MEQEKQIKQEKVYSIKITDYEDGTSNITYDNKNFNIMEIIGVLEYVKEKVKYELIK